MKKESYTFYDLSDIESDRFNRLLEDSHKKLFFDSEYMELLMKYNPVDVDGKYALDICSYIEAIAEILYTESDKLSDRIDSIDTKDSVYASDLCKIYLYQCSPNSRLLNKLQFLIHIHSFYFNNMDNNEFNCIIERNDFSNRYAQIFENNIGDGVLDILDIDKDPASKKDVFNSNNIIFAIDSSRRVSITIIKEYDKISPCSMVINTHMFAICSNMEKENKDRYGSTIILLDKSLYYSSTPRLRMNPYNENGNLNVYPYDNNMSEKPLYYNNFKQFTAESYLSPNIPLVIMDTINNALDNEEEEYGVRKLSIGRSIDLGYILEKMTANKYNDFLGYMGYTAYMNTRTTYFHGNKYSQITVNDISSQFVSAIDIQSAMINMGDNGGFISSIYRNRGCGYCVYHFGTEDSHMNFKGDIHWHLEKKITDIDKFTIVISRRYKNSPLYWFHILIASSYNPQTVAIMSLPYDLGYTILVERDDEDNILSFSIIPKGIEIPIS